MASSRTGVYVDDFLADFSSVPHELRRLLSLMRELDERSQTLQREAHSQCATCLDMPQQCSQKSTAEQKEEVARLRQEVHGNQEACLNLCTEKVLLAQQAYDLIGRQLKRLDADLQDFEIDLKRAEGKLGLEESFVNNDRRFVSSAAAFATPPPVSRRQAEPFSAGPDADMDGPVYATPSAYRRRSAMPSQQQREASANAVLLAETGNEPTYCICGQVSFGDMIACDNEHCTGGEWFHYECVGLVPGAHREEDKWFCPKCSQHQNGGRLRQNV